MHTYTIWNKKKKLSKSADDTFAILLHTSANNRVHIHTNTNERGRDIAYSMSLTIIIERLKRLKIDKHYWQTVIKLLWSHSILYYCMPVQLYQNQGIWSKWLWTGEMNKINSIFQYSTKLKGKSYEANNNNSNNSSMQQTYTLSTQALKRIELLQCMGEIRTLHC